jgi:Fe-S-cluster-containing dehydrogenase component
MMNRRGFMKRICLTGAAALGAAPGANAQDRGSAEEGLAVLVDTTLCVGCRTCEQACNEANQDLPRKPENFFTDTTVFNRPRRMDASAFTVVNRYPQTAGAPVHVKFQCMHCLQPACVSACLVGALRRDAGGAVIYDETKCIGCRYCMAACPFQVPAYEYESVLMPRVRKCTFCFDTRLSKGELPACVAACPMRVMSFGLRDELIALGRERIRKNPGPYETCIYGEHEAGGTAWIYLAAVPFDRLDFPRLGYHPLPGYTEPIQHALFKWFLPPLGLFAALAGAMWYNNRRGEASGEKAEPKP